MLFTKLIRVKCPYCGTENIIDHMDYAERDNYTIKDKTTKLAYCDDEIGGCEKPFAVTIELVAKSETFKLMRGNYEKNRQTKN